MARWDGWWQVLTARVVAALAAMSVAMAPAASAAPLPPPPASGVSPATVSGPVNRLSVFYTAADHSVWTFPPGATLTPTKVSAGYVIGPVAAINDNGTLIVFGEGYGGALSYATQNGNTWTNWTSLGGIVSYPAAVYRGSPGLCSVFVRGADGAVWARDHGALGWNGWHKLGGLMYANTGPAAGYAGGTHVMVVGLDKQLWVAHAGVTGFGPVGGQTTASPALTSVGGVQVGFVRGTDNAAWYHRFLSSSPGWRSIGGSFTSGLAATNWNAPGPGGQSPATFTVGLGRDSQIWANAGIWTQYPPLFGSWFKALGLNNF